MSEVRYRFKNQEELDCDYYYVPDDAFIITDRCLPNSGLCEEEFIINKIRDNEEGYFDFSKNLIDVGSEDGNYAMLLDFANNYIFEPNKRMCALIHANSFLKDKVYNSDIYNIGLSDKDGVIKFNGFCTDDCISKDIQEFALNNNAPGYGGKYYDVPVKTLDSFNIQNVGLIKIDVEGMEDKVIRGGLKTIVTNDYPPILFECWNVGKLGMTQEYHDRLFSMLTFFGYKIIEQWGDYNTHLAIHR